MTRVARCPAVAERRPCFFSNGRRRLKVEKKMELGEEGSQVLSDSSSILSGLELNCFELI